MIASVFLLPLLWAYSLCHLPTFDRRVFQAALVPLLLVTTVSHYLPAEGARVDWRDNVSAIRAQWQPGDVIYYGSINACIALGYYLQGYDYRMRHTLGDLNQSMTTQTEDAFQFKIADFGQLGALGYTRAWLIADRNPLSAQGQIDEINHILTSYPNKLIADYFHSDMADISIYLVDLNVA